MAEWLKMLIFTVLNCLSSHHCGFEPSSNHVRQARFCLWVVRWFFSGISRFHPTLPLTWLRMSETILTGCKTQIKNGKEIFVNFQTSKQAPSKGKVLSAKISAKVDTGRSGVGLGGQVLAPPMSSVIVERHQPVTKVCTMLSVSW